MPPRPAATPRTLQAVLFDMDGTLVDTEDLWRLAVEREAEVLGLALGAEDEQHILGRPIEYTAAHLHRSSGTGRSEESLAEALGRGFAELVGTGVEPLPGALALLDALGAAGIRTALVSASPRNVVDTVLDALGRERFTVSFAAGETPRTKPAPDPYLAAAAALDLSPDSCVAVEDTPVGVASAEAAGCTVLAVPSAAPIPAVPGRTVVSSLLDVDLPLLRTLIANG